MIHTTKPIAKAPEFLALEIAETNGFRPQGTWYRDMSHAPTTKAVPLISFPSSQLDPLSCSPSVLLASQGGPTHASHHPPSSLVTPPSPPPCPFSPSFSGFAPLVNQNEWQQRQQHYNNVTRHPPFIPLWSETIKMDPYSRPSARCTPLGGSSNNSFPSSPSTTTTCSLAVRC